MRPGGMKDFSEKKQHPSPDRQGGGNVGLSHRSLNSRGSTLSSNVARGVKISSEEAPLMRKLKGQPSTHFSQPWEQVRRAPPLRLIRLAFPLLLSTPVDCCLTKRCRDCAGFQLRGRAVSEPT